MMRTPWKKTLQLAAVVLLAACNTDVTGYNDAQPAPSPAQSPAASIGAVDPVLSPVVGTLSAMQPLHRKAPLARDVRVARVIGRNGGTIRVPEAGFTLTVPAGAVAGPTRFEVNALQGREVAYEFEPHGTVFARSLVAVQDLSVTRERLVQGTLMAGYFADRAQLGASGVGALVSERIPGLVDARRSAFRWPIDHFSGYIVAW
jgi:hypothetical protein